MALLSIERGPPSNDGSKAGPRHAASLGRSKTASAPRLFKRIATRAALLRRWTGRRQERGPLPTRRAQPPGRATAICPYKMRFLPFSPPLLRALDFDFVT